MLKRQFKYDVAVRSKQFYLLNERFEDCSLWQMAEDCERLLSVAPGVISVGTISDNEMIPVIVEIAGGEPNEDMSVWDQVNECTLEIPSGCLVIAGIGDGVPEINRINVLPGSYRARVYYNLDSLTNDDLDRNDHYKIVLWKAAPGPVLVLKQATKVLIKCAGFHSQST